MATPLISVVVPCYNAERFLIDTVESVFQQTFCDYEIILVDDGSRDATAAIIRSFGSKVRAEFGPNRGASAARNLGTELAYGEFIQYLDADDLLRPDALEKRINALVTHQADIAYSDWQRLVEVEDGSFKVGEIVARCIEDIHPIPEIALFTSFWAPPAALLYRTSIVNAIGAWNESLPVIQDARFLLDAALVGGKFVYVPGIGADYRVHNASLSKRNPLAFVQDCYCNASQVEEIWRSKGGITLERRTALLQGYGQVARFFFEHHRVKFDEVLQKIYQLEPDYLPSGPKGLRFLARWVGYRTAEQVALRYRKAKKIFQ